MANNCACFLLSLNQEPIVHTEGNQVLTAECIVNSSTGIASHGNDVGDLIRVWIDFQFDNRADGRFSIRAIDEAGDEGKVATAKPI